MFADLFLKTLNETHPGQKTCSCYLHTPPSLTKVEGHATFALITDDL